MRSIGVEGGATIGAGSPASSREHARPSGTGQRKGKTSANFDFPEVYQRLNFVRPRVPAARFGRSLEGAIPKPMAWSRAHRNRRRGNGSRSASEAWRAREREKRFFFRGRFFPPKELLSLFFVSLFLFFFLSTSPTSNRNHRSSLSPSCSLFPPPLGPRTRRR